MLPLNGTGIDHNLPLLANPSVSRPFFHIHNSFPEQADHQEQHMYIPLFCLDDMAEHELCKKLFTIELFIAFKSLIVFALV